MYNVSAVKHLEKIRLLLLNPYSMIALIIELVYNISNGV